MSHLPTLGSCSDLVPYPVSVHTHLGLGGLSGPGRRRVTTGFARGFLSSDDHLALLYRGPNLEVLNARTNERLAAWTFENLKTPSQVSSHPALSPGGSHVPTHEITCCTELVSPSSSIVNPNASSAGNPNASHLGGPHCPPNSARRAVVVGLANGLVCVLDLKSSRIIRAIQTGYRVASVAVISSMGGPMSNHRNMAEEVRSLT